MQVNESQAPLVHGPVSATWRILVFDQTSSKGWTDLASS